MPTKPLTTSYKQDLALFPDRWNKIGLAFAVLGLFLFPIYASGEWMTIGSFACIYVVGAVGMMILTGFCGQISLGHAAFLGLGAYSAGILGTELHLPFWLCIPAAGFIAAAFGLAIGPFALRLEGLYLAIVTLGMLFLVEHLLLTAPDLTGGIKGMAVPMHSWFGDAALAKAERSLGDMWDDSSLFGITFRIEEKRYVVFVLLAVLAGWCAKNLRRSNTGRAMMAVRDHDLAAAVLGVSPARTKIIAFGLSSFFAGVAGAMFAYQQPVLTVNPPFNLEMSVQYIAMIVLGGIGTVFGAIWGGIAFAALSPLLEHLGSAVPYIKELTSAQQSTLLFSLLVIGFLVVEPFGLYGIWLRVKRYFMAWPFRY